VSFFTHELFPTFLKREIVKDAFAKDRVKNLAKTVLPEALRFWLRHQQRRTRSVSKRLLVKRQDLKDRLIIKKQEFKNQEGFLNFDFTLLASRKREGVSAILRVKNEEEKIYHCLRSILDIFDEIVFVDNGSEDRTLEIARQVKARQDNKDKIKIYIYPFTMARLGPEHANTPEHSVYNFSYYYNWTLSQCSFRYVCKWDGDMLLRKEAKEAFRSFLQRIQKGPKMCWITSGQTVYRDLERNYYLAKGEINDEITIFPNGLNPRFYKAQLYEMLRSQAPLDVGTFQEVLFYELKFVNTDEFSHWSISDIPTPRKQRELQNFQLIKRGDVSTSRFEKLSSDFLDDEIDRSRAQDSLARGGP
jgi:hypothetical protein